MTFLISLFQPPKCLVLVSQTRIDNCDEICRDILLLRLCPQLVDDLFSLATLFRYSISVSERSFHSHITFRKSDSLVDVRDGLVIHSLSQVRLPNPEVCPGVIWVQL